MVNVGGIGDALEIERMVWGMATLCKNCGRPLQYDPLSKRVVCRTCGSAFAAENVEAYGKKFEEERSELLAEIDSEFSGGMGSGSEDVEAERWGGKSDKLKKSSKVKIGEMNE